MKWGYCTSLLPSKGWYSLPYRLQLMIHAFLSILIACPYSFLPDLFTWLNGLQAHNSLICSMLSYVPWYINLFHKASLLYKKFDKCFQAVGWFWRENAKMLSSNWMSLPISNSCKGIKRSVSVLHILGERGCIFPILQTVMPQTKEWYWKVFSDICTGRL